MSVSWLSSQPWWSVVVWYLIAVDWWIVVLYGKLLWCFWYAVVSWCCNTWVLLGHCEVEGKASLAVTFGYNMNLYSFPFAKEKFL